MGIAAASCLLLAAPCDAATPVLKGQTDRPLRYRPEDRGFVIDNGPGSFNRPLYGGNTAFRIDAGDKPEFSLYLPGRGGVLRVGLSSGGKTIWLRDAANIRTRYADAAMEYVITDPAFSGITVRLTAVVERQFEGLALRATVDGAADGTELLFAFGGVAGDKAKRNGDIGTENVPMSQYFALKPDHCRDNAIQTTAGSFIVKAKAATIAGGASAKGRYAIADARQWNAADALARTAGQPTDRPVGLAMVPVRAGEAVIFNLGRSDNLPSRPAPATSGDEVTVSIRADPAESFESTLKANRAVAQQVVVDTPDPFVNSAVAALCVAADAIRDQSGTVMHGGVAWRMPLLGWRGPYAFDASGQHDYARSHLDAYFKKQLTRPPVATQPAADEKENLARSETQLRTDGDLTDAHYDMNLVAVDMFFRHLLWTGDLDYARKQWPVIQKHIAWEKRLLRRPFGPEGLPLYEAYACIWASDDLQYSGGGVTHASAFNYYHNTMAARVATLLGEDPKPYAEEAALIKRAMQQYLWLPDRGWYAENKDLLGLQLVHPAAALWTHYHTIDSQVPDPLQAWQMCRYVDTQIPHIPITGKDVPPGLFTLASTNWMPYTWSINNVVMAEVTHTALADWQAGRPDAAFSIFKGAIVDSMFVSQCPGNVQMTSFFDAYRQEAQRDSGDPIGATWRAVIEGLFGITPDALAGELVIKPGFPADWDHASIKHPDISIDFKSAEFNKQHFIIEPNFLKPMSLRLRLEARRPHIKRATVNGQPAVFKNVDDAVGRPQVLFTADPAKRWDVEIVWADETTYGSPKTIIKEIGGSIGIGGITPDTEVRDPQKALRITERQQSFQAEFVATPGPATVFVKTTEGQWTWWATHGFDVVDRPARRTSTQAGGTWETVDIATAFNDSVTQIFKNRYVSPRSPYCSLAIPIQGFGGWATNKVTPVVDDAGLRAAGGKITLPQGVPFATPAAAGVKNILVTSQWDNYPQEATVPLTGKAQKAYLLMAGTTNAMQSRIDNGEIIVMYADHGYERLALRNPETWWPIEQDYFVDDFAFSIPGGELPPRVDLKTGKVRLPTRADLGAGNRKIDGGAATVLNLPLDPKRELKSLTVRTLANDVVIGLMSVTLQRP